MSHVSGSVMVPAKAIPNVYGVPTVASGNGLDVTMMHIPGVTGGLGGADGHVFSEFACAHAAL
jgi:hypothetical protein